MILRSGGLLEGVLLVLAGGLGRFLLRPELRGGGFALGAQLREALAVGLARALRTIFYADQLDLRGRRVAGVQVAAVGEYLSHRHAIAAIALKARTPL